MALAAPGKWITLPTGTKDPPTSKTVPVTTGESSGREEASGTEETATEATSTSTTSVEEAGTEIIHLTDAESRETDAGDDTNNRTGPEEVFKIPFNQPAVLFFI